MLIFDKKAVAAEERFGVLWALALADGDRIVDTFVTAPGGLIADRHEHNDTVQSFWLTGGTPGTHVIRCSIRTELGETPFVDVKITVVA